MMILTIVSTVIGALVVLVSWRIQLIGKRRFEFAEDALIAFSEAKEALAYVRNPFGYQGEGSTRERDKYETDQQQRHRDKYFVPIERLRKVNDRFSGLEKIQLLSRYHFGQEAYKAFQVLYDARAEVIVSAEMLMDEEPGTPLSEEIKSERRNIYASGGKNDEITSRIQLAQEKLEKICAKHFKYRSVIWPF